MRKKMLLLTGLVLALMAILSGCCFHEWTEATCVEPKTCSKCGGTEGEPLGHEWLEATCTERKICINCNQTEGLALGHDVAEWTVVKDSTCAEEGERTGVCKVCKETVSEVIKEKAHTVGDWEVVIEATAAHEGKRAKICSVCNEQVQEEWYELTDEEKKQYFMSQCKSYTYQEIARNPDSYKGCDANIKGQVIQVIEDGDDYTLRVNITPARYYWNDTILVSYEKKDSSEARILEDDIVMMYGTLCGTYTYETVMGADVTVPLMLAEYIDIVG